MSLLKYDGYYYFFDKNEKEITKSINCILRFYEKDRTVIRAAISISTKKDKYYLNDIFPKWDGWFSKNSKSKAGYYDIFKDKIRFEFKNGSYMGTIVNNRLKLFLYPGETIEKYKYINYKEFDNKIDIGDVDENKNLYF